MVGLLRVGLIAFLAAVLWLPTVAQADSEHASQSANFNPAIIGIAELPPQARDTLRAIKQGGPFAYPRDGVAFGNYERILPEQSRGYYHEYTVRTPGLHNRGARRIICGPLTECYYTADHYKTFKRIRE
jgi:ribonuclease T1